MTGPGFFQGIFAFYAGAGFVASSPRLWRKAAMPIVWLVLVAGGLGVVGVLVSFRVAERVFDPRSFWGETGQVAFAGALALVSLAVAALVGLTLAQSLSSASLDSLAKAQVAVLGQAPWPAQSGAGALGRSLRSTLVGLAGWLAVSIVFAMVGLVIPGAVVVTLPLELLASGLLVAWDLLDYPCALAGLGMRERLRWMRAYPGACLGFGLVGACFALMPLAGLLVLPFGVAGATRLFATAPPIKSTPGP